MSEMSFDSYADSSGTPTGYLGNVADVTLSAIDILELYKLIVEKTVQALLNRIGRRRSRPISASTRGGYVFASNRGHDSLTAFDVGDPTTPVRRDVMPRGKHWLRNFTVTPSGGAVCVCHQRSDEIVPFAFDPTPGEFVAFGRRGCWIALLSDVPVMRRS